MKKRIRWDNIISLILTIMVIAFIVTIFALGIWVVASVIDTNAHNHITSETYQQFAEWNLFTK